MTDIWKLFAVSASTCYPLFSKFELFSILFDKDRTLGGGLPACLFRLFSMCNNISQMSRRSTPLETRHFNIDFWFITEEMCTGQRLGMSWCTSHPFTQSLQRAVDNTPRLVPSEIQYKKLMHMHHNPRYAFPK